MSPSTDNRVRIDYDDLGRGADGDKARYHSHADPCPDAPLKTEDPTVMPLADAAEKAVLIPCRCAPRAEEPSTVETNNPREWSA